MLSIACGSSEDDPAKGDDDGGEHGGSTGGSVPNGAGGNGDSGTAGRAGGTGSSGRGGSGTGGGSAGSPGSGSSCAELAECCPKVADSSCDLVVEVGDETACALALVMYAAECPSDGSETTPDGWAKFPPYTDPPHELISINHLFATRSGVVLATALPELGRSTDEGRHFTPVGDGEDRTFVLAEAGDGTLFGTNGPSEELGLVRSTDEGLTWEGLDGPFTNVRDVFVKDAQTLYVVNDGIVYLTGDGGDEWEVVADASGTLSDQASNLVVDSHGSIYVFVWSDLWLRRPNDARWLSTGLPGEVRAARILPDDTLVVATDEGFARSVTYGEEWQIVRPTTTPGELLFDGTSGLLFANDGEILVSPDQGASWQPLGPDITNSISAFTVLPDGTVLASAYDLFQSPPVTIAPASSVEHPAPRPSSCYDGARGQTETEIDCGGDCGRCLPWERLPNIPYADSFITSRDQWFATGDDGDVFLSTDFGRTWESLGFEPEPLLEHEGVLYARFTDDQDVPLLMVSNDWGQTWDQLNTAALPAEASQLIPSESAERLVMSTRSAVYVSDDRGETFALAHDFGDPELVTSIAELGGELFVIVVSGGTESVLYRSSGDFSTWDPVELSDPSRLFAHDGILYVTLQTGLAKSDATGTSFSLLPGSEAAEYPESVLFTGAGTLLFGTPDQGVYACDESSCTTKTDARVTGLLWLFSDGRLRCGEHLSTAPVDW